MKKIIIAIDGFSSCGKSTLAKQLAKELGYVFIDSGAMYRAITLFFLEKNIGLADENAIEKAISEIDLKFIFNKISGKSEMYLKGVNVEEQIRSMQVSNHVSEVAALEKVRTFAVAAQQKMGAEKGLIMDGRDVGTNVFPNAELKIFMTASIEVRTQRRYDELALKNPNISLEEVKENLEKRDLIDTTRAINPLRKADDARVLDNSNLTMEEQLAIAKQWAENRMNE